MTHRKRSAVFAAFVCILFCGLVWQPALAARPQLMLQNHEPPKNILLSANGKRMLTFNGKATSSRVWDVKTGRVICVLGEDISTPAVFNADGTKLLTRLARHGYHRPDKTLRFRIWDIKKCGTSTVLNYDVEKQYKSPTGKIPNIGFSYMALAADGTVTLIGENVFSFDAFDTGKVFKQLSGTKYENEFRIDDPDDACRGELDDILAYSDDGSVVVETDTGYPSRIHYTRVRDRKTDQVVTLSAAPNALFGPQVSLSRSGRQVVFIGDDDVYVHNLDTGKTSRAQLDGAARNHRPNAASTKKPQSSEYQRQRAKALQLQSKMTSDFFQGMKDKQCNRWLESEGNFAKQRAQETSGTTAARWQEQYDTGYAENCGTPEQKIAVAECPADRKPIFLKQQDDIIADQIDKPGWIQFSEDESRVYIWFSKLHVAGKAGVAGIEERALPDLQLIKTHYFSDQEHAAVVGGAFSAFSANQKMVAMTNDGHMGLVTFEKKAPRLRVITPAQGSNAKLVWGDDNSLMWLDNYIASQKTQLNFFFGNREDKSFNAAQKMMYQNILSQWDFTAGQVGIRAIAPGNYSFLSQYSTRGDAFYAPVIVPAPKPDSRGKDTFAFEHRVIDLKTGKFLWRGKLKLNLKDAPQSEHWPTIFSRGGEYLAVTYAAQPVCNKDKDKVFENQNWYLDLFDPRTGELLDRHAYQLTTKPGITSQCYQTLAPKDTRIIGSPDGKTLIFSMRTDSVKFTIKNKKVVNATRMGKTGYRISAIGPGDKPFARMGGADDEIEVAAQKHGLRNLSVISNTITFDRKGKRMAAADEQNIALFELANISAPNTVLQHRERGVIKNTKPLATLKGHRAKVHSMAFSPDGKYLASRAGDGQTIIWDIARQERILDLYAFPEGTWVVVSPDGRFDTNNIEKLNRLHWIMPDDPLTPLPLEVFMREYFEPRLLAKVMAGAKLPPVRDVSKLVRAQPKISIAGVVQDKKNPGTFKVGIRLKATRDHLNRSSEVHDIRLFRNGRLVATRDGKINVDPKTGQAKMIFRGIKLPQHVDGDIEFSAYAFNQDGVKSQTARRMFKRPTATNPKAPNAYIISVGVNRYQTPGLNLDYAANDATQMQSILAAKTRQTGKYKRVISINLTSDNKNQNATKQKILSTLRQLGRGNNRAPENSDAADKLSQVGPDDVVIFTFSGHGVASDSGEFYLLPSDIGTTANLARPDTFKDKAISTQELENIFRTIDAGDFSFIIDACQSAASFESPGFKPGPMGSKGLGQLAYDKGIRILAASQAQNAALEVKNLRHGLLTYTLLQDGVVNGSADFLRVDNQIQVDELLRYAEIRVPHIMADIMATTRGQPANFSFDPQKLLQATQRAEKNHAAPQKPKLFDFVRTGSPPFLVNLAAQPDNTVTE